MLLKNKAHEDIINAMCKDFGLSVSAESLDVHDAIIDLLKKVNRPGMDKLIAYLEKSDFFTAPASTKFHGDYEGGLAVHSLNVCALFNQENKLNQLGLSDETVILCALLHDICKVGVYVTELKNVKEYNEHGSKHDSNGSYDWVTKPCYVFDDPMPLGHGEKSLYILQGFLPNAITREEAFLIRWHMGPFSTADQYGFNNAVDYQPSVVAMYTADLKASSLYEEKV